LVSLISIGVVVALVERPTVRYLHLDGWLFFLMAGVALNRFLDYKRARLDRGPRQP
jgi:hypothetical protein